MPRPTGCGTSLSLRPTIAAPSYGGFTARPRQQKEGIDADLKAFKEKGVGGVVFYDQIHGKAAGAAESMSDEWWESLKYAAMKARETGLSFEVAASNGYVAGARG